MSRSIFSNDAPRPIGPYSQAMECGNLVFVSGQLGIDPSTGQLVEGGIGAETTRCLKNINAILSLLNLSLKDVVKTIVFMTDLTEFKEMNLVYASFFQLSTPARSVVEVSRLPLGAKIEIEAIASFC
ncbi:MAG: RidA family protein [Methanomassiliicoccales archaeon]